jgi:hypothetical protein
MDGFTGTSRGSQATTEVDKMGEGQSEILASLEVGAMVEFQMRETDQVVVPTGYMGQAVLVPGSPPDRLCFTITMYEFNGEDEAKISLAMIGESDAYWACDLGSMGELNNPLGLGPEAGQFLLTDEGGGAISIRNAFAPPSPFIGLVRTPDFAYYGAGFEQGDGQHSLFTIFACSPS